MNQISILIKGERFNLKVGDVMPFTRGKIIIKISCDEMGAMIKTNPPPSQGQFYIINSEDVLE